VGAKQTQLLGNCRVLGRHHAPFRSGQDLDCMKTEDRGVGIRAACGAVEVSRACRVRGVLQHAKPVPVGQSANLAQVARQAPEIDRDQQIRQCPVACCRLELGGQGRDRQIARARIDIDEINCCAAVPRAVRRCQKTVGAGPHARAGPDAQSHAGDVQTGSSTGNCYRVGHTVALCESLLEGGYGRSLGQKF